MRAVDTLAMLKARGVTVLQSRPREGNDNLPSDNFFASLNIHMGLDSHCYESVDECSKAVCKAVAHYNNEHHRGIISLHQLSVMLGVTMRLWKSVKPYLSKPRLRIQIVGSRGMS